MALATHLGVKGQVGLLSGMFIYGAFQTRQLIYAMAKIKTELIDFNKLLKNYLNQVLISSRPFWSQCGFNTSLSHLTAATILATTAV